MREYWINMSKHSSKDFFYRNRNKQTIEEKYNLKNNIKVNAKAVIKYLM